ncbi:hypothetical protein HRI_002724400 [Hibiscus trionum]|uniref:Uncharacterized protein n=1 Tax=Hibiscus trionum TaxID=183268 RepID=A0A9W7I8K6_HIBTR|nr:hypothetical protein HRI_002724400 [Hibiscus trionum]
MADAEASLPLKPQEVAAVFVEQYYLMLRDFPQQIYRFYDDSSMVSRSGPDDVVINFTTIADIEKHLLSSLHCKQYRIVSCDSQWTFNQSLFVVVIGYFTTENDQVLKFNQSFVLAPIKTIYRYFISNDILKFIDEEERIPTAVSRSIQCDVSTLHIEDASTVVSNLTEDDVSTVYIEPDVLEEDVPIALLSSTFCIEDVSSVVSNLTEDDVSTVCIEPDVPSLEEDVPVPLSSSTLCTEGVLNDVFRLTQHNVPALHIEDMSTVVPATTQTPTIVLSSTEHDEPTFCMEDFPAIASSPAQHVTTKFDHLSKKSFLSMVQNLNENNAPFKPLPARKPMKVSSESKRSGREEKNQTVKVENIKSDGTTIFVGNLAVGSKPEQFYQAFKIFGRIKPNGVQIKMDRLCRKYAFIQFESSSSAKAAIQASFIKIGDRKLNIEEKK